MGRHDVFPMSKAVTIAWFKSHSRVFLILITVLGLTLITGGFAYYSFTLAVKESIDEVEVDIESITLTDITSTTISGFVTGQLSGSDSENGKITQLQLNLLYQNEVIGKSNIPSGDITIKENHKFNATASLSIINYNVLGLFFADFLTYENVTVVITGKVTIEAKMLLPISVNNPVSKTVVIEGMNGTSPKIEEIDLIRGLEDILLLKITFSLFNPTSLSIPIDSFDLFVYYNNFRIGKLVLPYITLLKGQNLFSGEITLWKNVSSIISNMLASILMGKDVNFDIKAEMGSILGNIIFNTELPLLENVSLVSPSNHSLIDDFRILDTVIFLNYTFPLSLDVNYKIITQAIVYNPLNFALNITHIHFSLYFCDSDGVKILGGLVWKSDPKYHIFITKITSDYPIGAPLTLKANATTSVNFVFLGESLELGLRLYDEYVKNKLYLDIENGFINVNIQEFNLYIHFEYNDIYFPANRSV